MPETVMKKQNILWAIVLSGIASLSVAQADCRFSITRLDSGSMAQGSDYDVFNSTGFISGLTLEVTRDGAASLPSAEIPTDVVPCSPAISIAHSGSLSLLNELLRYELVSTNAKPDIANGRLTLGDSAYAIGERRLYQVNAVFPAFQFIKAGEYTGEFAVSVVDNNKRLQGVDGTLMFDDSASRILSIRVPGAARLSLAGTQQRRQIVDFGTLEVGKSSVMPVALTVQSTASYQLRLRSENSGQLKRLGDSSATGIVYETLVENRRIALDTGFDAIVARPNTSETGDSIPLSFRIVDVRGKPAGVYADKITITVVPSITEF